MLGRFLHGGKGEGLVVGMAPLNAGFRAVLSGLASCCAKNRVFPSNKGVGKPNSY